MVPLSTITMPMIVFATDMAGKACLLLSSYSVSASCWTTIAGYTLLTKKVRLPALWTLAPKSGRLPRQISSIARS